MGALTTNYANNQNQAAVTQNAGFSSQTANQLGLNITPGLSSGGAYARNNQMAINAVGPNAPSSVQFGFQGGSTSPNSGGGQMYAPQQ